MKKKEKYSNQDDDREGSKEGRGAKRMENKDNDSVWNGYNKERNKRNKGGGERKGGDENVHRIQCDSNNSVNLR